MVCFWSLSAQAHGKIKDTGVEVTTEKPYVGVKKEKLNKESVELFETIETYLETVISSPVELEESIKKLGEISEKAPDAMKDAKEELESGGKGFKEKVDAVIKMKKNITKLSQQIGKCKKLSGILKEAAVDVKALLPQLKSLVTTADEVGAKANDEKLYLPHEIFDKHHTGLKKAEKEAEKKEKADEKKEKAEEKKEAKQEKATA